MKGFVYLFREKGAEYIKIGMTCRESVYDRFAAFKMYSPKESEIVHVIEAHDAKGLEKELHEKYAHLRANGEFFKLSQKDINDLKELQSNRVKILEEIFYRVISNEKINEFNLELLLNKVRKFEKVKEDYSHIVKFIIENFKGQLVSASFVFDSLKNCNIEIKNIDKVGKILTENFEKKSVRVGKNVRLKYFI